jgi:hypothetical protein
MIRGLFASCVLLLSVADAAEFSCPRVVAGGTKPTILSFQPQARGRSHLGPVWACQYDKQASASVILLEDNGPAYPIGLISTAGDCTEIAVHDFLTQGDVICVEYITDNAGCELPVPREKWVTCFSPSPLADGHWVRSPTVLLERRSIELTPLVGPEYEDCRRRGLPEDNCVTQSVSTTVRRARFFGQSAALCITDEDSRVVAVLGAPEGSETAACAGE